MSNESIAVELTTHDRQQTTKERLYRFLLFGCAALTVAVTASIIVTLAKDARLFFEAVSLWEFLTGTEWSGRTERFGILPLVTGTLTVTLIAAIVAIPIGTAAATYLSEYASDRARSVLKPALEILAGIPTVVYGYLALVYLTSWLDHLGGAIGLYVPGTDGFSLGLFNAFSASIMVGIMIIPMVSSISEDAMSAVPDDLRQAGYALGATRYEVSTGIVVPAAVSGIFASYILALSRAIGETMIVVMAMGMQPNMFDPADPLGHLTESGEAMTAAMVHAVTSDVTGGSPEFYSMFAIGLVLFAITFSMNLLSNQIADRYREEYR